MEQRYFFNHFYPNHGIGNQYRKQAKEDYMIARERYRAGEGMMLDIIDAQLALSTAELNAISAQYDYARNKAALENAIGI